MWAWAIQWLDLSCASVLLEEQSGLMKGDYSVIDYSMQYGPLNVGVSVVAAYWFAAFPFPPCGLALSAELRLYPDLCFQSSNFDDMACSSLETVFNWTFLRERWNLDKTVVGQMVDGRDSCAA